jgi:uncharacterized protein (TIGR00290 family)
MSYALLTSGDKDSVLTLDRARRNGIDVQCLVSIYQGPPNRVSLHGVRPELIELQAQSLGLELVTRRAGAGEFDAAFTAMLEELKDRCVEGLVCGHVHMSDVRAWCEKRVLDVGLRHLEPILGEPPIELLWEVVERGYQAIVTSVDLSRQAADFLGRELDADLVTEIGVTDDLDPCAEAGEYQTFVYDGPAFSHAVPFEIGETLELQGHRFVDLKPPALRPK